MPSIYGKSKTGLYAVDLKCEYETNPIGIDAQSPQLSWRIESGTRNTVQTAYQIMVASTEEQLKNDKADIWDSGQINSSASTGVSYEGQKLTSRQRYYWKVRIWKNDREVSEWSLPAFFEMGLLNEEDWKGGWIGYAAGIPGRVIYFKGTFAPQKAIKDARVYISGLGFYEMEINRKKVGDHVLDPAQSTYSKRVYYVTYDVKDYFTEQANTIVVTVAPGWNGTPKLRFQMEVTYEDGSKGIMTSNEMRAITTGPTVYTTVFDGEHYDARELNPDLYKPFMPPGLMNKEWGFAYNADEPVGKMVSQRIEPIKIVETYTPTVIKEPKPGVFVIDAGRNLSGWASIKVQGESGRKVTLKFAETLYDNGLVNQDNLRYAKAEDSYTLNGNGIETWEPKFTYHGFRYIQIEGLPKPPATGDIQVKFVRSAVAQSGSFKCSNQLLNDIHRMVVNTEAANLHSVPTDCPQRDERMGWLNDLTVRIEQAIYNFNLSHFYPKYMIDITDTQDKAGTITCVAPYRFGMRPADPVSASYLLLAYKCYEFYGNKNIITDHFDNMKAWVDYLYSRTQNGIVDYSYYGDWCPPRDFLQDPNGSGVSRDTPGRLISTGYLYCCADLLAEMAGIIGRDSEVTRYKNLAQEIATAFNREYWNEQTGGYASNNQACNSFALYLGLADEKKVPRVINNLVEDVKKQNYHLTTGNLCTKYLLETLTEYGYHEVAYKIATQTTYPSWGFMLANGATTLWERWEFLTGDAMNSHNHPMMGSVGSWFYKYVIGINPDIHSPAFGKYTIHPYIFDDLTFAEGELITEKGTIKSAWKKQGKSISLDLTIPANTTATVFIPTTDKNSVTENGKAAGKIKELKFVKEEPDYVIYQVGSGTYKFKSDWK
ncbi:MAG: glycoside hydrolase family 78 protein [Tannerella sp.]|nr:glycoside hydrolase family 78 protein [Tannerella sp.]